MVGSGYKTCLKIVKNLKNKCKMIINFNLLILTFICGFEIMLISMWVMKLYTMIHRTRRK